MNSIDRIVCEHISTASAFSSPFSLDKLYPKSSLDAFTPPPDVPSGPQTDQFNGFIPTNKLTITYASSGGPGGQHMQKSHTKVCISFHLDSLLHNRSNDQGPRALDRDDGNEEKKGRKGRSEATPRQENAINAFEYEESRFRLNNPSKNK